MNKNYLFMGQVKTPAGVYWYMFGIGNTIRTAEAVGVGNVHLLYKETGLDVGQTKIVKGNPDGQMLWEMLLTERSNNG